MRFYLSARYSRGDELREVRERLQSLGHEVASRWLDTTWTESDAHGSAAAPPEMCEEHAIADLEDVLACDSLVAFTNGERGRGGRHVEYGAALATGKQIVVIGPREHIFHHHPAVKVFATLDAFLAHLEGSHVEAITRGIADDLGSGET